MLAVVDQVVSQLAWAVVFGILVGTEHAPEFYASHELFKLRHAVLVSLVLISSEKALRDHATVGA